MAVAIRRATLLSLLALSSLFLHLGENPLVSLGEGSVDVSSLAMVATIGAEATPTTTGHWGVAALTETGDDGGGTACQARAPSSSSARRLAVILASVQLMLVLVARHGSGRCWACPPNPTHNPPPAPLSGQAAPASPTRRQPPAD